MLSAYGKKETRFFHGGFYGLQNFWCKTVQFCATRRESESAGLPSVRNAVQCGENTRKNSFLNYESPALTTELQLGAR